MSLRFADADDDIGLSPLRDGPLVPVVFSSATPARTFRLGPWGDHADAPTYALNWFHSPLSFQTQAMAVRELLAHDALDMGQRPRPSARLPAALPRPPDHAFGVRTRGLNDYPAERAARRQAFEEEFKVSPLNCESLQGRFHGTRS